MNDKLYVVLWNGKVKGKRTFIYEHRKVMEEKLRRKLKKKEIVHHKNGNKKDNRPENLEIMLRSEHMKHHNSGDKSGWWRGDVKTSDLVSAYLHGTPLRKMSRDFNIARTGIKNRLRKARVWVSQR